MSKITKIHAYEVIDSRGFPTVAATVTTEKGFTGKAMVPSGASTGEKEAVELRDGDKKRFNGKGVLKAVENVNKHIAAKLTGMDVFEQRKLDEAMIKLDGTPNKAKLGANAILAVSLAAAKAAALEKGVPLYAYVASLAGKKNPTLLPLPMLNVINGGAHADNDIDFQEFMFFPVQSKSIHEAVQIASECFHALQSLLHKAGHSTAKGDEGGFAPNLKGADDALSLMVKAIEQAGYKAGRHNVAIAMDPAMSELYDEQKKVYVMHKAIKAGLMTQKEGTLTSEQLATFWKKLVDKFPIISLEDNFAESDWEGFSSFTKKHGANLQIVGDDLYCTNPVLVAEGLKRKATNSVLIKVNQIGTLTETIETVLLAQKNDWTCVVSHRSGETEDTTIADLAVGLETGQIKTGSMSRSERVAKYNRLLEIENELGASARFLGEKALHVKLV